MSQTVSTAAGTGGDVPADLKCGFCKKPIQGEFYRALTRFACTTCAAQAKAALDKNVMTTELLVRAGGAGLLVGLGCAVVWAVIVHVSQFEIGIVASLIGFAVAKAMLVVTGKRRGAALQWLAVVLSVIGVACGKLMLLAWQVVDYLNSQSIPVTPRLVLHIVSSMVSNEPTSVFRGFDLLWMGIAAFAAFRLCKAPKITIAGPFPYTQPGPDLQFHTVEPAEPPPAPQEQP